MPSSSNPNRSCQISSTAAWVAVKVKAGLALARAAGRPVFSLTIRAGGDVIKLKQRREVLVNGEEAVLEPSVWIDGVYIRHASSVFLSGPIRFHLFIMLHSPSTYLTLRFSSPSIQYSRTAQWIGNLVGRPEQVSTVFALAVCGLLSFPLNEWFLFDDQQGVHRRSARVPRQHQGALYWGVRFVKIVWR